MQPAVLTGFLNDVNKVGKFPAAAAQGWPYRIALNPDFDELRAAALGPRCPVDPQAAIMGEE
jgi:hypothetical protein